MDLGTGGGLPGVPLAIARGDVRFTLVDRSERKVRFVARTIRELELDNVTVCCADLAAALPADVPAALAAGGGFAAVVSRAVADPARLWALAAGHLRRDGVLMIMHHGQRGAGAPAPLAVPAGARVVAEREVDIPGLPDPHGIVVLGREVSGEGE